MSSQLIPEADPSVPATSEAVEKANVSLEDQTLLLLAGLMQW